MNAHFVDVWQGRLNLPAETLGRLDLLLSEDERSKAQSFKFPHLRDRYIAARGMLRQTLAGYLAADPAGLRFVTGDYGKPALAGDALHFNVSHTADALIIAIADIANIGVDIETVKPHRNLDSLAERCFSEREYRGWRQLAEDEQLLVFYRLWTKKEAFVKAVGRGIAVGVERCEFEWVRDGRLLAIPSEYGPAAAWREHELEVDAGFSAALVTPDARYDLRHLMLGRDLDGFQR